jgi:adenylate kinase family enzyme
MASLILVVGNSGVGKTTFTQRLAEPADLLPVWRTMLAGLSRNALRATCG